MKFSIIRDGGNTRNITCANMQTDEYDKIMGKSKEFLAAEEGVGPYVAFGLSNVHGTLTIAIGCLLYTSPSPRDGLLSRMPSSA